MKNDVNYSKMFDELEQLREENAALREQVEVLERVRKAAIVADDFVWGDIGGLYLDPKTTVPWVGQFHKVRDELREALAAAKPATQEGKEAEQSSTAWLIERSRTPVSWLGVPLGCHGRPTWGTANDALRFAREEDAQRCAIVLGLPPDSFRCTEHAWLDGAGGA